MTDFLYLDIETIPAQSEAARFRIAETIKPPAQMKKPETIARWEAEEKDAAVEEALARTGLNGGYGHVCCIGWAGNDENVSTYKYGIHKGEKEIISDFFRVAGCFVGSRRPVIIGHNVAEFDLKFLRQRAMVLGIKIPAWFPINPKPWGDDVFDTMTAWAGPRDRVSLDDLCFYLGIEGKGAIDGSMVADLFARGEHEAIAQYCRDDVVRVRSIHKKMRFALGG